MSSPVRRHIWRMGIAMACALASHLVSSSGRASNEDSERVWLHDTEAKLDVLVYPPKVGEGGDQAAPKPVTVMLHGMCDEPENECPYFADSVTSRGWLICPRARLRCEGGGSIWHYQKRHDTVERSIELVHQRFRGRLDETGGRTLIGFSLGAIFGMDLAHQSNGRYRRVVLIGAKVHPWAKRLEDQGVERIVFASGDYDMMRWHMARAAERANRGRVQSRFVSFGKVGHWFPRDLTPRMDQILDWLEEPIEEG